MNKKRKSIIIAGLTLATAAVLAACGGSRFLTLIEFNGNTNATSGSVVKPYNGQDVFDR